MSKQTGSRHSPTGLTPSPSPRGEGSEMPCWGVAVMLVCSCNSLTSFIISLVRALHIVLFSFVVALHITPLSPWRGVGGEALYKTGATQYRPPHLICYAYKCPRRDAISASITSHLASIGIARMLIASSAFRSHSVQSSTVVPRYG